MIKEGKSVSDLRKEFSEMPQSRFGHIIKELRTKGWNIPYAQREWELINLGNEQKEDIEKLKAKA